MSSQNVAARSEMAEVDIWDNIGRNDVNGVVHEFVD